MKNLSLTNLNSAVEVLSRDQMKKIVGGSGCCVFYRDTSTKSYTGKTCGHSVSYSQYWYNNKSKTSSGDNYVSGYCCTSC